VDIVEILFDVSTLPHLVTRRRSISKENSQPSTNKLLTTYVFFVMVRVPGIETIDSSDGLTLL
jgi:hypothetical protein